MSLVEVAFDGPVATLSLNRPEARNALDVEMCKAIVESLESIDKNKDARVVIVRGEGNSFCSGADFAAVSGTGGVEFVPAFEEMLEAVGRFRMPTVAAVHGAALGGGFQLACVCDFRIAASDAKIGIPSAKLGILVNFENIQRLVLLVGIVRAKEVLLTARTYSGAEAARAGLVTKDVPSGMIDVEARRYAKDLAEPAPLSVQGAKRAIQVVVDHLAGARRSDPDAATDLDELVAQAYGSADLREGLAAMNEKRPPRFTGV